MEPGAGSSPHLPTPSLTANTSIQLQLLTSASVLQTDFYKTFFFFFKQRRNIKFLEKGWSSSKCGERTVLPDF